MKRLLSAFQTPRSIYPSVLNSFPVIRTASAKKLPFSRTAAHIFVSPADAPASITQYVAWMERQFNACQTPRSMFPSSFNSFPVIRAASAKNRSFHILQPTFLFPLETPLRLSRNVLHGWKDISMLVKPLAACTHLSSTVSQLFEPQVQKIAPFLPLPSPPLRSRAPLNQLEGLGEHCKLPQFCPGRKQIWCSLELSESHWWQLF